MTWLLTIVATAAVHHLCLHSTEFAALLDLGYCIGCVQVSAKPEVDAQPT